MLETFRSGESKLPRYISARSICWESKRLTNVFRTQKLTKPPLITLLLQYDHMSIEVTVVIINAMLILVAWNSTKNRVSTHPIALLVLHFLDRSR
jgi:hypothetical protein